MHIIRVFTVLVIYIFHSLSFRVIVIGGGAGGRGEEGEGGETIALRRSNNRIDDEEELIS